MWNSKEEYLILSGPYNKEQLRSLVKSGQLTKASLVKLDNEDKIQNQFKQASSIAKLEDIFLSRKIDLDNKIQALTNEINIIWNTLKGEKESSNNRDLDMLDKLSLAVNDYLKDDIYTVYLTTGFDDKNPAFLILIENDSTPLKIGASIPIDKSKVKDFEKWPDIAKNTSTIWKMSK